MKLEYLKNRFKRFIRHFTFNFEKPEYDTTPRMEYRVGESGRNTFEVAGFGYRVVIGLPNWIKPYLLVHTNPHLAGTPAWESYYAWTEKFPKVFGWYLYQGHHFVVSYGRKTHSSTDTQTWSTFLPWVEKRLVEKVLIDANTNNEYFISMPNKHGRHDFDEWYKQKDKMPKREYQLVDYDGTEITASVYSERLTYKRGIRWCKWMSWFYPDEVYHRIDISFDKEVGKEKGSWKGGLLGTSYPIELAGSADDAMHSYIESRNPASGHRDDGQLRFR